MTALGDAPLEPNAMPLVDALEGEGADLGLWVLPVEDGAPLCQGEFLLPPQGDIVGQVPDVVIGEFGLDTSLVFLVVVDDFLHVVFGHASEGHDLLDGHLKLHLVGPRYRVSEPKVPDSFSEGSLCRSCLVVCLAHDAQLRINLHHQ